MKRLVWGLTCFVCTSMASPVGAATIFSDYRLNGTFADSLGNGPALSSDGGTLSASGYSFLENQGLVLSGGFNDGSTIFNNDYSIALQFQFAKVFDFNKVLDYSDTASENGLYVHEAALEFFNFTSGGGSFPASTYETVVITRDGTSGEVQVYLNGSIALSFTDSGNDAVFGEPNQIARFIEDDALSSGTEASAGTVTRIQIYRGALSAAEVNSLDLASTAAVPEPASLLTLALGGLGVASYTWRPRRVRTAPA